MTTILSLPELVQDIKDATKDGIKTIAVDGRGGSGKSTLAKQLGELIEDSIVLQMDDFYLPKAQRPNTPDVPGSNFDRARLIADVLAPHKEGKDARYQRYDWDEDALAEYHEVPADKLVIIEGVYSLSEIMRPYSQYGIFVDCPYEVRLARGIERDGEEMRDTWVNLWMPAEDNYLAAEKPDKVADLVVSGDGQTASNGDIVFTVPKQIEGRSL